MTEHICVLVELRDQEDDLGCRREMNKRLKIKAIAKECIKKG
jgi:hypothetical protein